MFRFIPLFASLFIGLLGISCYANGTESQNCISCHAQQVQQWQNSDHGKAMAPATDATVLGDFNNASIKHFSQLANFYKKDDHFFVSLEESGKQSEYEVAYVFGHHPLQQYLIQTELGKFQVFPFAWDSRDEASGGQRWYSNNQNEDIHENDRLHWKQPMQNWNGMCADCHSTGLTRNFSTKTLSFNTHFDEINVSCASCHGEMSNHYNTSSKKSAGAISHTSVHNSLSLNEKKELGKWLLKDGDRIAHWQGEKRDNKFMASCFGCHSLRSPLNDGINTNTDYLDQFTPSLLIPPLYFEDGQIREEVYVYGSFLQSRMYEAGVNCIDCHNPHTMKVKVEGNGLCLQCHSATAYEGEQHTKHPPNTEANKCVNCHMPTTTYMGVDARRDHSFSIPTPHIAEKIGSPNACLNCHNKDNEWVSEQLSSWYGRDSTLTVEEEKYVAFMHGETMSKQAMLALVYAKSLPVIKRATVLASLPSRLEALSDKDIRNFIHSKEPLLRLAAAQAGRLLPPNERLKSYASLLNDKYKAIRVASVNNLIGLGLSNSAYKRALQELTDANAVNQWRGEGNINQSLVEYQQGNIAQSEALLKQGIKVDPYFEANYINLAELYRAQGTPQQELNTLELALEKIPTSDLIYYSLGMLNIRTQNKMAAVKMFEKAVELAPDKAQNWYIYALALDNTGQTANGINALKKGIEHQYNNSLAELGMSLSQKMGDRNAFKYFSNYLKPPR